MTVFRPILFNTEMVRAILEGRKTKTRRLVKIQPEYGEEIRMRKNKEGKLAAWFYCEKPMLNAIIPSPWCGPEQEPPCQPGDVLWVRETWTEYDRNFYYRADFESDWLDPCEAISGGYPIYCSYHPGCEGCTREKQRIHWRPSIHMPKKAARIFLRVKSVNCERLHKITANECLKEGIKIESAYVDNSSTMGKIVSVYTEIETKFGGLWDSTISKDQLSTKGWAADPWVWVIEFERVQKPAEWEEYLQ